MKKKRIIILAIALIAIFSLISPMIVRIARAADPVKLDYSGFVKCDGVPDPNEPSRQTPCNFAALMTTIEGAINWMFLIAIPVASVLFAFAGLLYMTGTPGNRKKANGVFTTVAIGFIIMLVAWISVRTVVDWFVNPDSGATSLVGGK